MHKEGLENTAKEKIASRFSSQVGDGSVRSVRHELDVLVQRALNRYVLFVSSQNLRKLVRARHGGRRTDLTLGSRGTHFLRRSASSSSDTFMSIVFLTASM